MSTLILSHKIITNLIKIFSFFAILGLLYGGHILMNKTNSSREKPVEQGHLEKPQYEVVLDNSVFEGVDKNLKYTVEAEKAIKTDGTKYELSNVSMMHELNENGDNFIITARKGLLNEETQFLNLQNNVEFFLENVIFNSDKAQINLINKEILGDSHVVLFYKNSLITADHFSSSNNNNLMIFKGNVFSTINIFDF